MLGQQTLVCSGQGVWPANLLDPLWSSNSDVSELVGRSLLQPDQNREAASLAQTHMCGLPPLALRLVSAFHLRPSGSASACVSLLSCHSLPPLFSPFGRSCPCHGPCDHRPATMHLKSYDSAQQGHPLSPADVFAAGGLVLEISRAIKPPAA